MREITITVLFCGKTEAYFSRAGGQRLESSDNGIFSSQLLLIAKICRCPEVGQGEGHFEIVATQIHVGLASVLAS